MPSYLVESYLADSPAAVAEAREHARSLDDAGAGVHYVRTTFLPGDVSGRQAHCELGSVEVDTPILGVADIMIRAEDIVLAEGGTSADVLSVEYRKGGRLIAVDAVNDGRAYMGGRKRIGEETLPA